MNLGRSRVMQQSKRPQTGLFFQEPFTLNLAITRAISSLWKGYDPRSDTGLSQVQNPGANPGFWNERGIKELKVVFLS